MIKLQHIVNPIKKKGVRDDRRDQIIFFFNIVQTAFDPPLPLVLEIYVADYIAEFIDK